MLGALRTWLSAVSRDRERRAQWLVMAALAVAAVARVGSARWGLPLRYHVDELGFVMWVAAHAEWHGFVRGSFEPTVTTYGPFVYELALATKWLLSGTEGASAAAHQAADGWAYLTILDDPSRTPLTMSEWIGAMRVVSAWAGVGTVLVLSRAARRVAGPEASAVAAWLAALAPGLVQVSHYYTPDGFLLLFEVMVLHAAALLLDRPTVARAGYAGIAIGLILATKMTGALVALTVPWALFIRAVRAPDVPASSALLRACASRFTWIAALASLATFAILCPWAVERGPSYFAGGGGPTSGTFMLGTLYESDFRFYDWRFAYQDQTRGVAFFTWLLPYAVGVPTVLAGLAGLFLAERRARLFALGVLVPTSALVAGWTVITIRYALPLVPPLLLSASAFLAHTSSRGGMASTRLSWRAIGVALTIVVLGASLARGAAWAAMFAEEDPRTLASRWIAAHARDGDVVVAENDRPYTAALGAHDEPMGALPHPMPAIVVRRLFAGDELGPAMSLQALRTLRDARFLVVSRWISGRALTRSAGLRSPEHGRFYRALFEGRLGYTEVARFDRAPRLGPITWDESDEEQLAVCFDHCPVVIFERTSEYQSPFEPTPRAAETRASEDRAQP